MPRPLGGVRMALGAIDGAGDEGDQRPHRLDLRPHGHEHAAHVGVADDRHGRGRVAVDGTALDARPRVVARLLVGALGDGEAFDADGETRTVHHREHVFDAAVLLADQFADGPAVVAIGHDRGGAAMDAHLLFERDAAQVIAIAERAVGTHEKLRHDEQRNAFDARRRVRRAREHHMHDVLGHVVLAIGDEDLLPGNAIDGAVLDRPRPQGADIGAGLGLCQVHGPGPFAADQLRQIGPLLRGAAVRCQ
jgi:hypothetical protein